MARFGETTGFPGLIGFRANEAFAAESEDSAWITVRRTGGFTGAVSVAFETFDASAVAGSDYASQSGQLDWDDGDATEKTIEVALMDNAEDGASKTFGVRLLAPGGGAALAGSTSSVRIFDDDMASGGGGGGGGGSSSSGGSSSGVLFLGAIMVGFAHRAARGRRPMPHAATGRTC
jgi:hypothetical protein